MYCDVELCELCGGVVDKLLVPGMSRGTKEVNGVVFQVKYFLRFFEQQVVVQQTQSKLLQQINAGQKKTTKRNPIVPIKIKETFILMLGRARVIIVTITRR